MASDSDVRVVEALLTRPPGDLLALAGAGADPDLAFNALIAQAAPDLADSLASDGLLPKLKVDRASLVEAGRRRIHEWVCANRLFLQSTVCPLHAARGGRELLLAIVPALLADAAAFGGVPISSVSMAMVAWLLSQQLDELCADWPGQSGPPATS